MYDMDTSEIRSIIYIIYYSLHSKIIVRSANENSKNKASFSKKIKFFSQIGYLQTCEKIGILFNKNTIFLKPSFCKPENYFGTDM